MAGADLPSGWQEMNIWGVAFRVLSVFLHDFAGVINLRVFVEMRVPFITGWS